MKIEQIFAKDINRNLNGVVKAEQLDKDSIFVELDEYIVTNELQDHFESFFKTYVESVNDSDTDLSGRIGVWISGFFGSGKSHFLKILSYLLENKLIENNGKGRYAYDFVKDKIKDNLLKADIKKAVEKDTDVILFNIDSRANADDKDDAILKVFLKVFNERVGYCGDFPFVAHIERELDKRNHYHTFKEKFREITGTNWEKERDAFNFLRNEFFESMAHATSQSIEAAKAHVKQMEVEFPLDVQNFCKWVNEYLQENDRNLLFLIDEVGQFIGKNSQMMLKLQTITESLGTICNGRAWVVVTSQADIDKAIGNLDRQGGQDFSKIQGRFYTRIQLSSSNTAEVIQKRLLLKTDKAQEQLTKVFEENQDVIRNQLTFDATTPDTLKSFDDVESFIANYPFITYQYMIAQKIFESIRTKGAAGKHLAMGERSLLDAFQSAAKQIKDEELDVLIPIYFFYNPIESFLEPAVKRTIEQAGESDELTEFDVKVLKTLFLIRYVDVIKSTFENLVTLSIDRIDTDKITLGNRIKDSLSRLERLVLIARSGYEYNFLTNEEKEIENEIRDTEIHATESTNKLAEIIFDEVLKGKRTYLYPFNNQEFGISRYCNGHAKDSIANEDIVVKVISPLDVNYESYSTEETRHLESLEQEGCIVIILGDQKQLWEDLTTYLKTERFLHQNSGHRPEQEYLMSEKRSENSQRATRMKSDIEALFIESDIYAIGKKMQNNNGSATNILESGCKYIIENSYSKLTMLDTSDNVLKELEAVLTSDDTTRNSMKLEDGDYNVDAIAEVRKYLTLKDEHHEYLYLRDIVNHFHKRPYGWPDYEILLLIARLGFAEKLNLIFEGARLSLNEAKEFFLSNQKRAKIRIKITHEHGESKVKEAAVLMRKLFSIPLNNYDQKEIQNKAMEALENWKVELESFKAKSQTGCYPGEQQIEEGLVLVNSLLNIESSFEFLNRFIEEGEKLEIFVENYEDLYDFFNKKFDLWQTLASALNEKFKTNRKQLEGNDLAKSALEKLESIYNNPEPYSEMNQINQLIKQVSKINTQLVDEMRVKAIEEIDKNLMWLQNELFDENMPTETQNQAIQPLQLCKGRVESTDSISGIISEQVEAKELLDIAIRVYNEYVAQERSKLTKNRDIGNNGQGNSTIDTDSSLKRKRIVSINPSTIVKEAVTGDFIESRKDIDNFLQAMELKLSKIIESGDNVRIE